MTFIESRIRVAHLFTKNNLKAWHTFILNPKISATIKQTVQWGEAKKLPKRRRPSSVICV